MSEFRRAKFSGDEWRVENLVPARESTRVVHLPTREEVTLHNVELESELMRSAERVSAAGTLQEWRWRVAVRMAAERMGIALDE